jgi:hypothetical protein
VIVQARPSHNALIVCTVREEHVRLKCLPNLAIYYLCLKVILKPIWTYGIELWGCAKPSNIKILQTYQSKTLRMITNAPCNQTLHDDLKILFFSDVIHSQAIKCRNRNTNHINELIAALTDIPPIERRLKRQWPEDLLM